MKRPQGRRCNPAVYTVHDAGQIVDQTAPFARLTAHALYPEQWSRRMYVWNPKVTTAAPAYIPTTNTAQRGMGRILVFPVFPGSCANSGSGRELERDCMAEGERSPRRGRYLHGNARDRAIGPAHPRDRPGFLGLSRTHCSTMSRI